MSVRTAFATPALFRHSLHHVSTTRCAQSLAHRRHLRRIATTQMVSTTPAPTPTPVPSPQPKGEKRPQLTLLYDSECPLCVHEVNFLRRRSVQRDPPPLHFVDIASSDYDPALYNDLDYETAMRKIHAIDHKGNTIVGVPVFRLAYEAVGLGWIYAVTKLPGMGLVAEKVYDVWARFRLQLTGRPPLEDIMALRRDKVEKGCN